MANLNRLLARLTLRIIHNPRNTSPRKKALDLLLPKAMSTWTCSKCTFINPSSQKSICQICLSSPSLTVSPSSSSSPSTSRWSCKACTFLNPYRNNNCEVCGTRASASSLSIFEDLTCDDEVLDSSVGSVFLPLRACNKRKAEDPVGVSDDSGEFSVFQGTKSANKEVSIFEGTDSGKCPNSLKILSYNVWFREDLEMFERMKAIGDLIQLHSPDIICFQEVTPNIYEIFQRSIWWKVYQCSVTKDMENIGSYFCMQLSKLRVKSSFSCKPFSYSGMGRELCVVDAKVQSNKQLVVATSHLESPCPGPPKWDQMFSKERVTQATEAVNFLKKYPNAIFCGDMNWDDKLDGKLPLPEGWIDVWAELKPRENGWTYDTKSNPMLSANRSLQKRLDRFTCNLRDFKITGIEMIGTDAIQGLTYVKEKTVKKEVKKLVLPVLPSDHFGLLLTISDS